MTSDGVTLQVSLSPADLRHAQPILEHQVRQLGGQVDRVTFTLDLHRSGGGRGRQWADRRPGMEKLLDELCSATKNAQVQEVDYSPGAVDAVRSALIDGSALPAKNYQIN